MSVPIRSRNPAEVVPICALPECNLPASRGKSRWHKCCGPEHALAVSTRAATSSRKIIDPDELRRLAELNLSPAEIGAVMGFEADSIRSVIKRHRIDLANVRQYAATDFWDCADAIVDQLLADKLSLSDIACRVGVTKSALAGRLHRRGLCKPGGNKQPSPFWASNDAMLNELRAAGLTEQQVAERLGTTRGAVNARLRRIAKRERAEAPRPRVRVEFPPPGHCQYAHGDQPHYDFCGHRAEPGSAWCLKHYGIVYRPAQPIDMRGAA